MALVCLERRSLALSSLSLIRKIVLRYFLFRLMSCQILEFNLILLTVCTFWLNFSILSLFVLLIRPRLLLVFLHHADCLVVEGRGNARRRFQVVVALQELVELKKTCSEVFHADITVLVEVKSEVVVLYKDLHVLIGASHIGN